MNSLGRKQKNKNDSQVIFTRETMGVVLALFSTLALVCLISRDKVFFTLGVWVNQFLLGAFGYFSYAVLIYAFCMGVSLIINKKLPISSKIKLFITSFFFLFVLLLHTISLSKGDLSYSQYLHDSYMAGQNGLIGSTAGGFFMGLVAYWFLSLLTEVGAFVIISLLLVGNVYLLVKTVNKSDLVPKKAQKQEKFNSSYVEEQPQTEDEKDNSSNQEIQAITEQPQAKTSGMQRLFVSNEKDFSLKNKKELSKPNDVQIKITKTGGLNIGGMLNAEDSHAEQLKKKLEYIKIPVDPMAGLKRDYQVKADQTPQPAQNFTSVSGEISKTEEVSKANAQLEEALNQKLTATKISQGNVKTQTNNYKDEVLERANKFSSKYLEVDDNLNQNIDQGVDQNSKEQAVERTITANLQDSLEEKGSENQLPLSSRITEYGNFAPITSSKSDRLTPIDDVEQVNQAKESTVSRQFSDFESQTQKTELKKEVNDTVSRAMDRLSQRPTERAFTRQVESQPKETDSQAQPKKVTPPINRKYNKPPIDLLERQSVTLSNQSENHQERMEIIKRTLEEFHISAEPQNYIQGPAITRYEVMMPAGISVKRVLNYDDDLKMRLSSRHGVRIEAPIPGKNLVGIEVANKVRIPVGLREVIEGYATKPNKPEDLTFAIGKDIVGNSITDNLAKGPHFLIAGATGSGKSVALNVMIVSLIMRYSPEELRLILVDPKRVGFRIYEHIPHLMIDEIVTEPQKAVAVLSWAYEEMEKRYKLFESCDGVVNDIESYNKHVASATVPKLARIVIIVDELADLMETCKKDMDIGIRRLAAKARAAGIHLVLATQRPSVDVITGTIKANLPSRMALKVMNFADSSTILSEGGAEKLLGNGDMLYKNSSMNECDRYQGAFVSNVDISKIVNYIKENNQAYFDDELKDFLEKALKPKQDETTVGGAEGGDENEVSEFFLKALWHAVNTGSVSISQLQRRFSIGFSKAGGIVDRMQRMGYVSPAEGSKPRQVLLSREEFEEKYGSMGDNY